jgi:hypothetical protein
MAERFKTGQLKLGTLIDETLSKREQARLLSRMRQALAAEEAGQRARLAAQRKRHREAPTAIKLHKAKQSRNLRLLTVLHTSADPDQIATARRELLEASRQPQHEAQPSGAAQHRESAPAARVQHLAPARLTFWTKLGPAPHCSPADTPTAMLFYRKVSRLIEQGGWTAAERAALHDLAAKWGPRALGTDARFNVVGTVSGRLPRALELKINELRKRGQE